MCSGPSFALVLPPGPSHVERPHQGTRKRVRSTGLRRRNDAASSMESAPSDLLYSKSQAQSWMPSGQEARLMASSVGVNSVRWLVKDQESTEAPRGCRGPRGGGEERLRQSRSGGRRVGYVELLWRRCYAILGFCQPFLRLLLNTPNPARLEPSSSMVHGSGMGVPSGTETSIPLT